MARPQGPEGLTGWLLAPLLPAWGVGLALAALFAGLEIRVAAGGGTLVALLLGLIVLLEGPFGWVVWRRNFGRLARASRADRVLTREELRAMAGEVAAAPDVVFWAGLVGGTLGSLLLGGSAAMLPRVELGVAGQVALVGPLFAPLTSLFAYLLVLRRSREALQLLVSRGLSPQDWIAAVPRRNQMRERLAAFTAIAALTPCVALAASALHHASAAIDQVAREPSATQRAVLAADGGLAALAPAAVLGALALALSFAAARAAGRALDEPMRTMTEQARRIAEGDLTRTSLAPAEDELWAASTAFAALHAHLSGVLSQLARAGVKISSTTEQIVQMSSRHQQGSTAQAASLNETMATTEELARSGRQIADNAGQVARIAEETLAAARAGRKNAQTFAESMGRMRRDNQGIADSVVRLNKRVQQIGKIVEFINGIADKSDLLALNAELEGTKAGEVGRGFSLVAAEMRRIAENVIESTRQIAKLIEEIRDATNAAVMATEAGVKATDAGAVHSNELSSRLAAIVDLASGTSDAIRAISLATQQQQAGTDQLALAMGNVLQVTQQSAQQTQQLSAANTDLVALSRDLKTVVDRFKVS